jgi:hypothetical protein
MSKAHSRRAVPAGIATAPALAAPALALRSAEPDPIFAAIEAHDRALKHYHSLESDFPGGSNWNAFEGCFLDPDDPQEVRDMVVNSWKAHKAEDAALLALLTTQPTTIAGAAALLDYAAAHSDRYGNQGIGIFDPTNEAISAASENFYRHLADSLRAIGGVSGLGYQAPQWRRRRQLANAVGGVTLLSEIEN